MAIFTSYFGKELLWFDPWLVVLHAGGIIHILMTLQQMISFGAYELRVNFIYQLKQHNFFLTVGEDEEMFPIVR